MPRKQIIKKQTSKKINKQEESSDEENPMKLRNRTKKYDYQEISEESDSSYNNSEVSEKVQVQVEVQKQKKKTKLPQEFKKGEYNHKIKNIPNINKQLEGHQKESYECCVRCANKELIRAVIIKDLKMFARILTSGKISHPFQRWAPDNNFTVLHMILIEKEKKFMEILIKQLNQKINFASEIKFGLKHIETGYNHRSAYGADVRIVEVSRQGRQGNNAFVDDVYREQIWSESLIKDLMQIKSDNQCWLLLLKSQLIPKYVIDRFYYKIIKAVECGNYKLAGLLVQQIYKYPQYGFNTLHFNVLTQNQPKDLGEFKKASATKKNSKEILTPIHCAAINPNPRILEAVLDICQEYSILDGRMRRPIHYAAANETSGCVELLIKKGVDVREGDNTKTTPLMIASLTGRLHNLEFLLPSGVDTKNRIGSAAIHFAAKGGHLDCIKFLVETQDAQINLPGEIKMTPLHIAAAFNHYQIVNYIINQGGKVSLKDKFGRTPLILAARNGSLKSLAYLLQNGGEYNLPDSSKNTPLHYAAAYGFKECVELLIDAGANQNLKNSWSLTPLSIALCKNHKNIVDYLLSLQTTNINCKDDQGRTLIANEILRTTIQIEYLESLFNKNADINICDLKGQSPLHLAAQRQNGKDAIKLLLKYGINVNIQDNNGQTAFISAIRKGNFENAKLILEANDFDKKQKDKKGQTLLQQIIENNAFLNPNEGIDLIENLIDNSTQEELQNININHLKANEQLFIKFTSIIKIYYHIELKKRIVNFLKEKYESGKFNKDNEQIEEEIQEDNKKKEIISDNMSEEEENDEDQESENNDQSQNQSEAEDQNIESKNTSEEENEEEIKNDEINSELLSEDEDDKQDYKQLEIQDENRNLNFKYQSIFGKRYKIIEPFVDKQKLYVQFDLEKYAIKYDIEFFDKKTKKNKKESLQISIEEVNELSQNLILYCFEIEKKLLKLFQTKLILHNKKLENQNGRYLIHYVFSCYPKKSFVTLFNSDIVKDDLQNSQYHYLQFAKSSPLYNINEITEMIPNNFFDENINGDTVYHIAAIKQIFFLNVNHINNKNQVPLFEAIKNQSVTTALLEQIDPNFIDRDERNGLHYSLMYNDQKTLRYLLNKGANPNQIDIYGRTPIFYAFLQNNNITNLKQKDPFELVVNLAKDCNQIDKYGRTVLHYAAQRGSSMSLRQLISKNTKGDFQDRWGNTPLSLAFLGGHFDASITLIDQKYNINTLINVVDYNDIKNELIIDTKEEDKKEKEIQRFLEEENEERQNKNKKDTDSEKSIQTCDTYYRNNLSWKLNRYNRYNDSDDENEKNINKYSPPEKIGQYSYFRMSLKKGWYQIQYLLLINGYPLNEAIKECLIENKYKRAAILLEKASSEELKSATPNIWHIFAQYGNDSISKESFKQIIESLSCVPSQITDNNLMSSLHIACKSGFTMLIKYLISFSININTKDKFNNTPFSYYLQSLKIIDIDLLNQWIKSDCNIRMNFTFQEQLITPLNYLTKYKEFYQQKDTYQNEKILDIFLKNGCNVNEKDQNGQTLLFIAIQQNNFNLIKAIWNYVDKKVQIDNLGRTPLHYVIIPTEYGTFDNIELLKFLYPYFNPQKQDNYGKTILDYVTQFDSCQIKTFLSKELSFDMSKFPRKTATSVISNVIWPSNDIDYINDATQYLNQLNQKSEFVAEVDFKAKENFPNTELYENYSCLLTKVDVNAGYYAMNVFYKMQILKEKNRNFFILLTRWGGSYSTGQFQHTPFQEVEQCIKEFKKVFKQKSGNEWGNLFISYPKKYHLVKLKPHRNIQQYLKPFSSNLQPKLSSSLIQLFQDFTNIKEYLKNLPTLKIEEDSLFNLAKEDLEHGEHILLQLEQVLQQFQKAKKDREIDLNELERLGQEIAQLSNQYYEYIPHKEGKIKISVSAIVNLDELNNHFKRVNTLMNFEVSTKILLGALSRQNEINPLDYCFNSLNIRILALEKSSIEYQMIEKYAQKKIKTIYCVERQGEAQKQKKLNNKYLLWHGTKSTNFVGILSLGLRIAPSWADKNGSNYGKGIYFTDSLEKSIGYTDDKNYLLLCEVALGKITEIDQIKNKYDSNKQYQSLKVLGKFEQKQNKCITIGNGCKVPIGELYEIRPNVNNQWNEYIVYSEDQVRIRYIVQIEENQFDEDDDE